MCSTGASRCRAGSVSTSLKSVALSSLSSAGVEQSGAAFGDRAPQRLAGADAGGEAGLPSFSAGICVGSGPVKLPQATQSGGEPSTQQTAPPAGERLRLGRRVSSGSGRSSKTIAYPLSAIEDRRLVGPVGDVVGEGEVVVDAAVGVVGDEVVGARRSSGPRPTSAARRSWRCRRSPGRPRGSTSRGRSPAPAARRTSAADGRRAAARQDGPALVATAVLPFRGLAHPCVSCIRPVAGPGSIRPGEALPLRLARWLRSARYSSAACRSAAAPRSPCRR